MEKFSVICRHDENSESLKKQLIETLKNEYEYDEKNPDYCFAIGGDGTFLYAIHTYIDILDSVKFVGIHSGTLGFFSDYNNIEDCVYDFKNKKGFIQKYNMLKANDKYYALNEIRVECIQTTQLIDIYINDVYFERFRGNGILVCTQLGSTGYNRSLHGAIIDHHVPCIEMVEIAGVNHQKYPTCSSPIIFDKNTKIKLICHDYDKSSILNDLDMNQLDEKELNIELSDKEVQILRFKEIPYLTRIKVLF